MLTAPTLPPVLRAGNALLGALHPLGFQRHSLDKRALLDAAQQVERDFLARLGPEDRATLQSAIGGLFRRG